MQIKFFTVPVFSGEQQQDEMNLFLRSHKIFSLEKEFVAIEENSYWSFFVQYDNFTNGIINNTQIEKKSKKSKIDYKEVLDSDTFLVYSKLREIRKQIAIDDGAPVYVVFTNEELASIASLEEITLEKIKTIKGIGNKRLAKYAEPLILSYNQTKL